MDGLLSNRRCSRSRVSEDVGWQRCERVFLLIRRVMLHKTVPRVFRWWWRGFHCNKRETPSPPFFTASPPRARIRYPLSFTCVRSSRHPAFLSGVQAWVSPRAAPLTRFWRQILVSLLCHSSHLNASLKAEADTQWTEERDAAVTNLAFLWGSPGGRLTLSLCRRSDPFLFTAAPPKMQVGLLYLWLTGSGCRKKKSAKQTFPSGAEAGR